MNGNDKTPFKKQGSLSHIEQSLKITPTPPQQAAVTIYPGPKAGFSNLPKADLEIADRLEKLRKKSSDDVPTEEEMASRLAQLKGLPVDHYTKHTRLAYQPPDTRSQVAQSDDLIKQVMEEVVLDSKVTNPDDEIMARLARLKGNGSPSTLPSRTHPIDVGPPPESLDFGNDEAAKLMKDAKEEVESARSCLSALQNDPEISAAVRKGATSIKRREREARRQRRSRDSLTSEEEKFSQSDESVDESKSPASVESKKKGEEEVERIVGMYMEKARRKKGKKKAKKTTTTGQTGGEYSDSSSNSDEDLRSSSDVELSTSESEKLSGSD